jgi:hypothetical protein
MKDINHNVLKRNHTGAETSEALEEISELIVVKRGKKKGRPPATFHLAQGIKS